MSAKSIKMKESWEKPELTVAGQKAFWDYQAPTYEGEDMTTDNQGEVDVVLATSREVNCRDIITLGGAVGCRDPKFILDDLLSRSKAMPRVVFNDLSAPQLERARSCFLKPYIDGGMEVTFLPGEIATVCKRVVSKPRRLILGVYNAESFFKADPEAGYPLCGFDEYLKNSRILGERFIFDWVRLSGGELVPTFGRSRISVENSVESRAAMRDALATVHRKVVDGTLPAIAALQIVGQLPDRDGFFLSHWYTPAGIFEMVRLVFPVGQYSIRIEHFAKGMVLVVDPIGEELQGIVTILNNAFGNVLPNGQRETLEAIKGIIS